MYESGSMDIKLHVRQPHNENGKKMMKYQGPHVWNALPKTVTDSASSFTFKKKIKKHLLATQNS